MIFAKRYLGAVAIAAGIALAGLSVPASAAPVGAAAGVSKADTASQVEQVGRRWHRRHWRGSSYDRFRYGHRRYGYYGYRRPYGYYGYGGPGIYLNIGPRWGYRRHWRRW
jgi:hypothetical protein